MLYDVSLEILQKCLNNCLHCSSNSCHNSKAILRLDTIKQIIDDIVYLGAKRLCLSGGEPFLHPDIIEIVEYATQKGLILDVYSSGIVGEYNLEKSISKEMLWECKKRGLNRIMFNVQAFVRCKFILQRSCISLNENMDVRRFLFVKAYDIR